MVTTGDPWEPSRTYGKPIMRTIWNPYLWGKGRFINIIIIILIKFIFNPYNGICMLWIALGAELTAVIQRSGRLFFLLTFQVLVRVRDRRRLGEALSWRYRFAFTDRRQQKAHEQCRQYLGHFLQWPVRNGPSLFNHSRLFVSRQ